MEKLVAALSVFGITGMIAFSLSPHKADTLRAIIAWLLGFLALVAIVLFAQAVVFEWLQWNGTTKNDWFFMLWWAVVLLWFVIGATKIFRAGR